METEMGTILFIPLSLDGRGQRERVKKNRAIPISEERQRG